MARNWIEEHLYLPPSNPFSIDFGCWTALWWRWLHSFPKNTNPATDPTGDLCNKSQNYQNVWFLAGTWGGSVTRSCRIPHGKALFFPIITSAFSFAVDRHLKTEQELTTSTVKDIDMVDKLALTIDDTHIIEFSKFRVRSKPFDDVIFGQPTRAVSDGYWIFLKVLSSGNHNIHFAGEKSDFSNEVTYYLSIDQG
jgi:hypothetical protein